MRKKRDNLKAYPKKAYIVVFKNGRIQLLDFYASGLKADNSILNSLPPILIKRTRALNFWGIDRLDHTSTVYHEALNFLVQRLETDSPETAELLRSAIFNLPIYIVDYEIGRKDDHFYLPLLKRNDQISEIQTSALYFKDFGVFVSKKAFDRLEFTDQVGLILHESLRHLQITHALNFSDQYLQEITATLFTQNGSRILRLNSKGVAQIQSKEVELKVSSLKSKRLMDQIISDIHKQGWTPYREEADMILQFLFEQNIILPQESNH